MKTPVLVFDFDGTIADTHRYIVEISNKLAQEFHYEVVDMARLEEIKNKTAREMIGFLKIPVLKIPAILARGKKEFQKEIASIKPFDGIKEILGKLKEAGVKLGILSSNSLENVHKFLNDHGLHCFDFIHTTPKIWSKNISLKNLIRKNGLRKENITYIGDETRDIDAARRLGIKVAAVTWGYNSTATLQKCNPDYLLHNPQDLLDLNK